MTTTVQIEDSIWKKLNHLKEKGETFQGVIDRLLILLDKYKLRKEFRDIYLNKQKEVK